MTPQEVNKQLKRGDYKIIAKATGYHFEYVGQILRGEHKLLDENKRIIDFALTVIETRKIERTRFNKILNKVKVA